MTTKKEMMSWVDAVLVNSYHNGQGQERGDNEVCRHYKTLSSNAYKKLESIADELENPFVGEYIDTVILGVHYHEYITSTGHRILVEQKDEQLPRDEENSTK